MLYREVPNRQLKVKVRDRMIVQTTDFERVCVAPTGLQTEIDKLVQAAPKGRAFVRYQQLMGGIALNSHCCHVMSCH